MTDNPHTAGQSILLHLAPGAVAMAVFIAAVPLVHHLGLPSIAALAVSGLLGVAPLQLALVARHRSSLTNRLPVLRMLGWVLVELILGAAAFALTAPLASGIRSAAFDRWPGSWVLDAGTHPGFSHRALLVTGLLMLLGSVLVAPVVEEYYFRGYLLPRMPGRLGPLAHAVLFAGYHLWTPWLIPTRILAIVPLAYIAVRTRDIRIGILTHVTLNAVDLALLARYLLTS